MPIEIEENEKKDICEALKIPHKLRLSKISSVRREEAIKEAVSWPKGKDESSKIRKEMYHFKGYKICLAKPGREANPGYNRCRNKDGLNTNNPNDMTPVIIKGSKEFEKNWTFTDMFDKMQKIMRRDEFSLELMGSLLFRNAYMLDHKEVGPGVWRLELPDKVIKKIELSIKDIEGIPIQVFLYFIDVLSLNEDVKYYTLGYDTINKGYGRRNNLLTCAHIVAVLLDRASLVKFAGALTRPPSGIASLSIKKSLEAFPLLEGQFIDSINDSHA